MITVNCSYCKQEIKRFPKDVKKNRNQTFFCNPDCYKKFNVEIKGYYQKIVKCANCNKEVIKSANQIRKAKHGKNYCSSSCAAIANNKITTEFKKKKTKTCKRCTNLVFSNYTYCQECWKILGSIDNLTLYDVAGERAMDATRYSPIRARCRRVYEKSDRPKCCMKCGYDKHYEVCHIKPISEFSLESLISEINSEENTVALCPNCHWEFDHGIITKEQIIHINSTTLHFTQSSLSNRGRSS
jgi:hypothetical protein